MSNQNTTRTTPQTSPSTETNQPSTPSSTKIDHNIAEVVSRPRQGGRPIFNTGGINQDTPTTENRAAPGSTSGRRLSEQVPPNLLPNLNTEAQNETPEDLGSTSHTGELKFDTRDSLQDRRAEYEHQKELQRITTNRLHIMEEQLAYFGKAYAPPPLIQSIREAEQELERIAAKITELSKSLPTPADYSQILSVEQQQKILLYIAQECGIPVEGLKLIDIVLGSVKLIMKLPLDGAAHLLALAAVKHPRVTRVGITNVELVGAATANGQPAKDKVLAATERERLQLVHAVPNDESFLQLVEQVKTIPAGVDREAIQKQIADRLKVQCDEAEKLLTAKLPEGTATLIVTLPDEIRRVAA